MTVAELISKLKQFSPAATVSLEYDDMGHTEYEYDIFVTWNEEEQEVNIS